MDDSYSKKLRARSEELRKMIEVSKQKLEQRFQVVDLDEIVEEGKDLIEMLDNGTNIEVDKIEPEVSPIPKTEPKIFCIEPVCDNVCESNLLPIDLINEIEAIGVSKLSVEGNVTKEEEGLVCLKLPLEANKDYTQAARVNATEIGITNTHKSGVDITTEVQGHMKNSKPSWKSVLTGVENSHKVPIKVSARSEMRLKYFSFESKSEVVDLIPDSKAVERWINCIVGHFIGAKLPFYEVKEEIFKQWGVFGLKDVSCTENGFYLCEFHVENGMDDILDIGHCHIFGRLMVLKRWHQMLKLSKEEMDRIPVWVRFYDLPYEFWSVDNLSKIASRIGKPLYMDVVTEKKLRMSYARICIEIDALKELQNKIKVRYGDEEVDVLVKYQWVPLRCESCKVFGHNAMSCPKSSKETQSNTTQSTMMGRNTNVIGPQRNNIYHKGNQRNGDVHNQWLMASRSSSHQKYQWQAMEKSELGSNLFTHANEAGYGVSNLKMGENLVEEVHARNSGKVKLVDRFGNVSSIKDIKKRNGVEKHQKSVLKVGNSFELIAGMGEGEEMESSESLSQDKNSSSAMNNRGDASVKDIKKAKVSRGRNSMTMETAVVGRINVNRNDPTTSQSSKLNVDANVKQHEGKSDMDVGLDNPSQNKNRMGGKQPKVVQTESKDVKVIPSLIEVGNEQPKHDMYEAIERLYSMQNEEFTPYNSKTKEGKERVDVPGGDEDQSKDLVITNPELESALFEAFKEDDNDTISTPLAKGLSFSDYPVTMSKKQKKKRIKAVQNAMSAKKSKEDPI